MCILLLLLLLLLLLYQAAVELENFSARTVTFTQFVEIETESIRKVYVDLYSALRKAPQMRSHMDHTVLPANYTMPAFTPQPQNITALWLVLILLGLY